MFLATVNKPKQLLYLSYAQHVNVEDLERGLPDVVALLAELNSGFRLVADLSRMDSMDVDCTEVIGRVMAMCEQKGVALVVRVIPDPAKDIGMNILTLFHYHHRPRFLTCSTLAEAAERLSL